MALNPNKIKAVFLDALEKPSLAERAAFVDEACAEDASLRQHVDVLLQAHDRTDRLLDQPAAVHLGLGADQLAGPENSLDILAPSEKPGSLGRLGHYEVLAVAGRGGTATVFRAFDEELERVVAIKVLAPYLAASVSARQRFAHEARAAAAVNDDNVIAIYAVGAAGLVPYMVMPFVDGRSLQHRLDRTGVLPLEEVLRIGWQVAEGLAAAHERGLVHRDVKPANILLENGGERVKLTDFGLARAGDDVTSACLPRSHSTLVAGTPMYMSPEQAQGGPIDCRSDLFSLGSVLYTMCTGQPPFRGAAAVGVLKQVCEDQPRPVRELNPELPAWLGDLIARLHAKCPADRIASAQEVAELLALHLAELTATNRRTEFIPFPIEENRRTEFIPFPIEENRRTEFIPFPIYEKRDAPSSTEKRNKFRSTNPRLRRRLMIAAAVLLPMLAGVGMDMGEATGFTDRGGTVVRQKVVRVSQEAPPFDPQTAARSGSGSTAPTAWECE